MSTLLSAQSLHVDTAFGPLFNDLSFTLKKGDRIGLIGYNGCGKSTLLQVLDGTLTPNSGSVSRANHCLLARVEQHLPETLYPLTMLDAVLAQLPATERESLHWKAETLLAKLQEGQNIALVSDAGTPLINDPGYHLVRTCREAGIRVVPLPGPCAAITALSAAGLPSDRFCYEGFLPAKSKGRRDALKAIEAEPRTLIFYESTHRLLDSLEDIVAVLGESRYVVLARELTKTWESIHGAPIGELVAWVKEDENRRKGEMVLIVEGFKAQEEALPAAALRTLALLQAELPLKKAAALAAEIHGVKKNALYKYALEQQGE